jgi:hypothetical protein
MNMIHGEGRRKMVVPGLMPIELVVTHGGDDDDEKCR